jgi:hypothetical protein
MKSLFGVYKQYFAHSISAVPRIIYSLFDASLPRLPISRMVGWIIIEK